MFPPSPLVYIIADKNCISAGWIIPGHVADRELRERNQFRGMPMEILFPPSPLHPRFCKQYPYEYSLREIHVQSVRNPLPSLFLNKFSCPLSRYLTIISAPRWIFTTRSNSLVTTPILYLSSSSSLRGGDTCIREKGRGWIPRDGFNWISNRKRIVKTRFGYVFVSKGDVSVRRRGGRRDVCATLGFVVHYCHRVFVVRFERDFSSFSSLAR